MTDGRERIKDQYGTVEKHVGECTDCFLTVVDDGSVEGFNRVLDDLARHIDDGLPCHNIRIEAVYEDGGELCVH